jgi:hypothetical protein
MYGGVKQTRIWRVSLARIEQVGIATPRTGARSRQGSGTVLESACINVSDEARWALESVADWRIL